MRPNAVLAAALSAVVVATSGCTAVVDGAAEPEPGPAPTQGPGSDPVRWTSQLCAAVLSFATPAGAAPDLSMAPDLIAVKLGLAAYMENVVLGVGQSRSQLQQLRAAPFPEGDATARSTAAALATVEQNMIAAKAAIDAADPNDPQAFLATFAQVEATIAGIVVPDPLGGLSAVPRLRHAAERAAECRQVATFAAAVPR